MSRLVCNYDLLKLIFGFMVSRVSASNCANIYHTRHEDIELPPGWAFTDALIYKHVNEGFKILSLLEHARNTNTILSVPHTAQHDQRFDDAMQERNRYIREEGQPELRHRCERCTRIFRDEMTGNGMDGSCLVYEPNVYTIENIIYAVLCDGITISRYALLVISGTHVATTSIPVMYWWGRRRRKIDIRK